MHEYLPRVNRILDANGFSARMNVSGRTTLADLCPPDQRCGIYVLHAANDEYYVGQAIDVTRRYTQHLANHDDIVAIRFKAVPTEQLDDVERATIWKLENAGVPLRNKALTSIPVGDSEFDVLMSLEQQNRWLTELDYADLTGHRPDLSALYIRSSRNFRKFCQQPRAEDAVDLLRRYISTGVPVPLRSEYSFWTCTCMPATTDYRGSTVLARLNIYWQEVLAVLERDGDLTLVFRVAKSPMASRLAWLSRLKWRWRGVDIYDQWYEAGGPDQISLNAVGQPAIERVLSDEIFRSSIRLFNLRLMKKGTNVYKRYHCPDLADRILELLSA